MFILLQKFEDSEPDVNSVLQGEIYAVRFRLDGSWNRAQVVSVSGDSILVQFLDFGNRDTVKFDELRQLTNEMMILPAQVGINVILYANISTVYTGHLGQ